MSPDAPASCDRPPPSIEQSVIGAVLCDGKDIFARCQALGVTGEWFQDAKCRAVFEAFTSAGCGPADQVLAWDELHRCGLMPERVTASDFCRMSDYRCATSFSLDEHVDRLRLDVLSRRRKGLFTAGALEEAPGVEAGTQERRVQELAATFVSETREQPLAAAAAEYAAEVIEPKPRILTRAIKTGLIDIDKGMGPFLPGQLILLGARPGLGKSSLARQIALRAAREDEPVHVESIEMTTAEFARYGAHQMARVPIPPFGDILPRELAQRVQEAATRMAQMPITMTGSSRMTPMLASWEALMGKARPPRLFVLDYIQLVDPEPQRGENRDQALGRLSKALKRFAVRWQVPILGLSAIGRVSEREDRPPTEADLRESGSLEGDADRVWILHRPAETSTGQTQDYSEESARTFEIHLYQRKARGAPTVRKSLVFDRSTTLFANYLGQ